MMQFLQLIKQLSYKCFPAAIIKQWEAICGLLFIYGQYKTMKQFDSVDANNEPLPWYTYPAIEYLSNFCFKDKTVFEYGSGNSSLWWAQRAKKVVSVEHNPEWFAKVQERLLPNQELLFQRYVNEYTNAIHQHVIPYDIIIIDGVFREECLLALPTLLHSKSLIIFDNADWYPRATKTLRETYNFLQVDFHGFKPMLSHTSTTSLLIGRELTLTPLNDLQPHFSKCARKKYH